jgi:hypothetical protein
MYSQAIASPQSDKKRRAPREDCAQKAAQSSAPIEVAASSSQLQIFRRDFLTVLLHLLTELDVKSQDNYFAHLATRKGALFLLFAAGFPFSIHVHEPSVQLHDTARIDMHALVIIIHQYILGNEVWI